MAFTSSVVSYPSRGPWGKASYRGNCSGHLVRDYVEHFIPDRSSLLVDPSCGSDTAGEVCREMGQRYKGLDLHSGFNILRDSISATVGEAADAVFYHPAYADMLLYSGSMYPEAHPDDLSRCTNVSDFLDKLQLSLMNVFDSLKPGGCYAVLMGDQRKRGKFIPLIAYTERLCLGTQVESITKIQHNTTSDRKDFRGNGFVRLQHERLMIFRKEQSGLLSVVDYAALAETKAKRLVNMSWRNALRATMMSAPDGLPLDRIYARMSGYAAARGTNSHWEAKIRQVLQQSGLFENLSRGVWRLNPSPVSAMTA